MKDGVVLNHRDRLHPVTQTAVPFYALNAANKKSARHTERHLRAHPPRAQRAAELTDLLRPYDGQRYSPPNTGQGEANDSSRPSGRRPIN